MGAVVMPSYICREVEDLGKFNSKLVSKSNSKYLVGLRNIDYLDPKKHGFSLLCLI
jgi:hypothetical protein